VAQVTNPFEVYRDGETPPPKTTISDGLAVLDSTNPYEITNESTSNIGNDSDPLSNQDTSLLEQPVGASGDLDVIGANNPFELGRPSNTADIQAYEGSAATSETEAGTTIIPTTNPKKRSSNNGFIFWFLLLSVLLLTAGITSNRKSFKNLYRLISNQNYLKLQNREQKGGKNVFYTLLYGSFVLNISIFCYLGYSYLTGISQISTLLKIIVIVTIVYGLRHFLMNFLKYFVDSKYLVTDYDFMITVINVILGLILLPIVLFTGFSGFTYIGLVIGSIVIVLLYFTRQMKGVMAAMDSNETGLFHFFIYLCTFELGPILIAMRLLKDYSGIM